jgi:hypothetical protein
VAESALKTDQGSNSGEPTTIPNFTEYIQYQTPHFSDPEAPNLRKINHLASHDICVHNLGRV